MTRHIFSELVKFDTPTICNALEVIDPLRRNVGYTSRNFYVINSSTGPVCGVAKTASCRSLCQAELSGDALKLERLKYYDYVALGDFPKIVVMQDLDGHEAGRGPFWGEFNVRIHRALGCVGVVTDGTYRDVSHLPDDILLLGLGLRPSHANIHVAGYGNQVNVFGMVVSDGMIVHADEHGAVCFPAYLGAEIPKEARAFVEREKPIIEACKNEDLTVEQLKELYLKR